MNISLYLTLLKSKTMNSAVKLFDVIMSTLYLMSRDAGHT